MVLYINCSIHAPGVKFGQAPEVDSLNRLAMGKNSKIFFSETTVHTALIFCMWQWLIVLYINCASHAPGVKFGHAPGVEGPELLYFVCIQAMFGSPHYKLCQSCPWVKFGHAAGVNSVHA